MINLATFPVYHLPLRKEHHCSRGCPFLKIWIPLTLQIWVKLLVMVMTWPSLWALLAWRRSPSVIRFSNFCPLLVCPLPFGPLLCMTFNSEVLQVQWPLSLVISRKALTKYQLIFRFLFHCKHVNRQLCMAWQVHQVCLFSSSLYLLSKMLYFSIYCHLFVGIPLP